MRIPRLIAFTAATTAAVATAAGVLAAPHAASARSVFVSLTLSPRSGPSTTGVTATYQYVPLGRTGPGGCGAELVTFTWDGQRPLGTAKPHPAGTYCVAALTFTPPPGLAAPGRHTVAGTQGSDTAQATFTVTDSTTPAPVPAPPPSQSPSAAASASPYPSPSGTPTATADPSVSPPASTDPLPSDEPSYAAGPNAAGGATTPPGGGSTGTFLAVLLGVFTMAGGGILLTLALHRRPDIDGAELPEDVPSAEA